MFLVLISCSPAVAVRSVKRDSAWTKLSRSSWNVQCKHTKRVFRVTKSDLPALWNMQLYFHQSSVFVWIYPKTCGRSLSNDSTETRWQLVLIYTLLASRDEISFWLPTTPSYSFNFWQWHQFFIQYVNEGLIVRKKRTLCITPNHTGIKVFMDKSIRTNLHLRGFFQTTHAQLLPPPSQTRVSRSLPNFHHY